VSSTNHLAPLYAISSIPPYSTPQNNYYFETPVAGEAMARVQGEDL